VGKHLVVLETQNLSKRYGDLTAVDHLDIKVYKGEVFGFLGPNGAGKTTSIKMMCGLLKADSGKVLLHGEEIDGGEKSLRSRVGVCPQDAVLWERLTCIEQLQFIGQMYGLRGKKARKRGEQLIEELDLGEKRNKQAHTLSGGMKRRLNLAMALVHDPEILILDEPEAGLDPQSRVRVREYIQSLAVVKTVILTTHNMDEADRMADRVAIIDHGKLLVTDTPEALKARVGEGDVLEITLDREDDLSLEALSAIQALDPTITVLSSPNLLNVRALNAVNYLSPILRILEKTGIQPGEARLRQNSLEDVFIQLTGRKLREVSG